MLLAGGRRRGITLRRRAWVPGGEDADAPSDQDRVAGIGQRVYLFGHYILATESLVNGQDLITTE